MPRKIEDILAEIQSGTLSKKQLENLRTNAAAKGGYFQIVEACDAALAKLPGKSTKTGGRKKDDDAIARKEERYNVMVSALAEDGTMLVPELVPLAVEISGYPSVENVAILKSQLRFYYKGHHMVGGSVSGGGFWVGVLKEDKLKDSTIAAWSEIGVVAKGKYFVGHYINVAFPELADARRAIEATEFVS